MGRNRRGLNRFSSAAEIEAYAREDEERQQHGGHRGGFGEPQHGFNTADQPVTFALGWGTKEGETLLADGHVDLSTFKQSHNHNHYGKGHGPHHNVKDLGLYSGPDA